MPFITSRGCVLYFEDRGQGVPVICFPAGAATGSQWKNLWTHLGERFRVIAPDFPGDGRSKMPDGFLDRVILDEETGIALDLVKHVGGRAHLVGHSYGGVQAMRVAHALGEAALSLTLLEPVAVDLISVENVLDGHPDLRAMTEACSDAIARGDVENAGKIFCGYFMQPMPWELLPANNRAAIAANIRKVHRGWLEIFALPDQRPLYRSLRVPTTLIRGDSGPRCGRSMAERLSELIPGATLRTIPGAGHMMPLSHPAQVNALVEEALNRPR